MDRGGAVIISTLRKIMKEDKRIIKGLVILLVKELGIEKTKRLISQNKIHMNPQEIDKIIKGSD